jgi:hypothetical protein
MIFSEENKLRILMNKNRDLRVVPFVGDEVSNPDWSYSMGSFDSCRVDEIVRDPYDDEHMLFKSTDYYEYSDNYIYHNLEDREEVPEEEMKKEWNNLDWERVILVFIETP